MKNLPLNAIRAFASVYLTGGIRPAGRALSVSHSSIAKHVKDLEAALGTPLLQQAEFGRSLEFSPAGEALGKQAVKSLRDLDKVWSSIKERRGHRSVVISAAPSVASLWLLPRMSKLSVALPKIEVSVLSDQRITDVSEGRFDLAIRMGGGKDKHAEPLMDDALVPVVAPRILDRRQEARPERAALTGVEALFHALPLLHDRDPNAGWDRWFEHYPQRDIDVLAGPRFTSSDLVLRAAKLGQGIALGRLRLAEPDLTDGSLVRLFDSSVTIKNSYKLICDPDQLQRRNVEAVRQWLLNEARNEDWVA